MVNPRASFDIAMVETPQALARTDYVGSSLTPDVQARLGQLVEYVQENPSAYDSHVETVKILHQGFVDHIYPSSSPGARRDPHNYDLLPDLRTARENMDKLFAVGEDLWAEWLQDESILAQSAEERVNVVELFRRAVEEEKGSVKLWTAHGDWVLHCYNWARDSVPEGVIDEERLVGKDIFTQELVMKTWEDAAEQTQYDLSNSHQVWDRYFQTVVPDVTQSLLVKQLNNARQLIEGRLKIPHVHWNETFQIFSSFVSANFKDEYEHIMSRTSFEAANAKSKLAAREIMERTIEDAQNSGNKEAEYQAFSQYIEYEKAPQKRKRIESTLINAIYERAELRFPTTAGIWESHVAYLIGQSQQGLVDLLARATKHCPWSGSLWRHYLLAAERLDQTYEQIETIKHKATSTGLLEAAGMEDVIKVYATWCGYLRRRIPRVDPDEAPFDIAEMGIRMAIETVQNYASKLEADDKARTSFRLRQLYISHLTQSDRWDNARQELDNAVRTHGASWEFWIFFWHWEMMRWTRFSNGQAPSSDEVEKFPTPQMVTAVLKQALEQPNLDYPEAIIERLVCHCEDYEDVDEIQSALVKVYELEQKLAFRRQEEAAKAAAAVPVQTFDVEQAQRTEAVANGLHIAKRKRDDAGDDGEANKKPRNEEPVEETVETTEVAAEQPKRDRENATILVENLPDDITEVRIRQFFSNCGVVRSLKVLRENGVSAVIEFDDNDAAKYALTRDGHNLDGAILSVTQDSGSTLFLTNYPKAADQKFFIDLLQEYGEIISVRLPSLQGNKRRRFCYVQFKLPEEAVAATELDGREIEGKKMVVKISNPAAKEPRKEREFEKRKIFVGQLPFKAKEKDIKDTFSQYGEIEFVKLPKQANNDKFNKGIAFITFASEDAVAAALAMNGKEFQKRQLVVTPAGESVQQRGTTKEAGGRSNSPALRTNGAGSPDTDSPAPVENRRQRIVALANVPDTVNESRIKAIAAHFGDVAKVVLKTNHQGAVIEYRTAAEAGAAALGLNGYEIDPGRELRVTTEQDMYQEKAEKKAGSQFSKPAKVISNVPIRRPAQPGARRGGHLGQKNMFRGADTGVTPNGEGLKKSNDDFRAMLAKKE